MDITYLIPMSIFGLIGACLSVKIFFFKREILLKTVANPKAFERDVKIMILASLFGALYFSFFLFLSEELKIIVNLTGYASGLLYVLAAFRMVRRYGKW